MENTTNAQLADGSIAPDWTMSDINGNSYNLYNLLDNGYAVIIDISATWCGPCWLYHQAGELEDVWINHGPAGQPGVSATTTDDVYVFMIESDGSTTAADLAGTGSNTTGDWITGTDFPIIDDASLAGPYPIAYYPTIYTICTNRQITETSTITAAEHYSFAGNCPSLEGGTDYSILSHNGDEVTCGAGSFDVEITIQNTGTTAMTNCTIEVRDGATVLSITSWTGNLASWGKDTVTLGSVNVSESTLLDIVIAESDADASNSTISKIINLAQLTSFDIEVNIFTDIYPSETSWKILDGTGITAATGGPYQAGTDDQWGAGGPDALTTKTHLVTLPSAIACYSFVLEDQSGNGLQYGTNPSGYYGYTVTEVNGPNLLDMTTVGAWNFGNENKRDNAFRTDTANGGAVTFDGLGVYPNPFSTTAIIIFKNNTGVDATIEVMNMLGQVVSSENIGNDPGMQNVTIDGSSFDAGIYMVNVKTGAVITSKRIVLTK